MVRQEGGREGGTKKRRAEEKEFKGRKSKDATRNGISVAQTATQHSQRMQVTQKWTDLIFLNYIPTSSDG